MDLLTQLIDTHARLDSCGHFPGECKQLMEVIDSLQRRRTELTGARTDADNLPLPRVIATFIPQSRHGEHLLDSPPSQHTCIDVTERVASMNAGDAADIDDGSQAALRLWNDHPLSVLTASTEPYTVKVQVSIGEYLRSQA